MPESFTDNSEEQGVCNNDNSPQEEGGELDEIKQVKAALEALAKPETVVELGREYPEDFVRDLKNSNPDLYNAFVNETPGDLDEKLSEVDTALEKWDWEKERVDAYTALGMMEAEDEPADAPPAQSDGSSSDTAAPSSAPSAPREVIRDKAKYKTAVETDENGEKFTVKFGSDADEQRIQIQDLVDNPQELPRATSSRYPDQEFLYNAERKTYLQPNGQRMLIFNGDVVTLGKAPKVTEVSIADLPAALDAMGVEKAPQEEGEAPAAEPVPAEAAPAPEPAAQAEAPGGPTPEKQKTRKEVVEGLLNGEETALRALLREATKHQLRSVTEHNTNHREFEIKSLSGTEKTSIHVSVPPLGTPKTDDLIFTVGDGAFGKSFPDMKDAFEGAKRLISIKEAREEKRAAKLSIRALKKSTDKE